MARSPIDLLAYRTVGIVWRMRETVKMPEQVGIRPCVLAKPVVRGYPGLGEGWAAAELTAQPDSMARALGDAKQNRWIWQRSKRRDR